MTVRDGWRWSLGKFVVPEDLRRLVEDDAVGLFQAEDLGIRHVPAGSVVRGVEHLGPSNVGAVTSLTEEAR